MTAKRLAHHPVAALFPMMPEDELADLAADIAERGLLAPIMLDTEGRILDGRNREAACRLAKVAPTFETYEGDDPDGYALAAGTLRRNLTQGQRAIVVARSYKLYEDHPDGAVMEASRRFGVPQPRLSEALLIIEQAPDLADGVLAGDSLSGALEIARKRQDAQRAREAKVARLRDTADDLLLRVDEGMDLDEAIAALDARELRAQEQASAAEREAHAEAEVQRQHAARVSDSFRKIIGRILALYKSDELRAEVATLYSAELGDAMPATINSNSIRQASDYLAGIAEVWEESRQ